MDLSHRQAALRLDSREEYGFSPRMWDTGGSKGAHQPSFGAARQYVTNVWQWLILTSCAWLCNCARVTDLYLPCIYLAKLTDQTGWSTVLQGTCRSGEVNLRLEELQTIWFYFSYDWFIHFSSCLHCRSFPNLLRIFSSLVHHIH